MTGPVDMVAAREVGWELPAIEPSQVGVGLLVVVGAYVVGRLVEACPR